jgi:hypothetical protein
VEIKIVDYNNPDGVLAKTHAKEWEQVLSAVKLMPLHLKASDQKGRQGSLIFDPVGTNAYLKENLAPIGWRSAAIGSAYAFLGLDVDFAKSGVILEAQFSNYPFLLNNLIRSEMFFRERVQFDGAPTSVVVILVKAAMYPASNSTLYYEQALNQLNGLAKFNLFTVPVRLIGLCSPVNQSVDAVVTAYSAVRYSRTVLERTAIRVNIICNKGSRCKIVKVDSKSLSE